jgi:hypothetical protein
MSSYLQSSLQKHIEETSFQNQKSPMSYDRVARFINGIGLSKKDMRLQKPNSPSL